MSWWDSFTDGLTNFFTDEDGLDWSNIGLAGGTAAGIAALAANSDSIADFFTGAPPEKVGYQGEIPRYTMVRDKVPGTNDPEREAGSTGQRYMTTPRYAKAEDVAGARADSQAEALQLAERNQATRMARGGLASIQRFAAGGMPQAGKMPMLQQANQSMGMPRPQGMPPQAKPQGMPPQGMPPQAKPPMGMPPQGSNMPKPPMGGAPQGMPPQAKPPMGMPPAGGAPQGMPTPPPAAPAPAAPKGMDPEEILNMLASTGKVSPPAPAPAPAPAAPPMGAAPQGMPPMPPQGMPPMPPQGMPPMPPQGKPMGFARGGIMNALPQQAMNRMPPQAMNRPMPSQGMMPSQAQGQPRYLGGPTDGMADNIPAQINGVAGPQPAALSDGEFVIPADVVSHLGNGNSTAGADQLYSMMDRIRQARTGQREQASPINPQQYMPKV